MINLSERFTKCIFKLQTLTLRVKSVLLLGSRLMLNIFLNEYS